MTFSLPILYRNTVQRYPDKGTVSLFSRLISRVYGFKEGEEDITGEKKFSMEGIKIKAASTAAGGSQLSLG